MELLTLLMDEIHRINVANGWFDRERPFSDDCMLIDTETAEAYEDYRNGMDPNEVVYICKNCNRAYSSYPREGMCQHHECKGGHWVKPEGPPTEMIDVIVRALDSLKRMGVDPDQLMMEKLKYNRSRGYRHGGKRA